MDTGSKENNKIRNLMMQCNGIEEIAETVVPGQKGTILTSPDSSNAFITIPMESYDEELCKTFPEIKISKTESESDELDQVMITSQLQDFHKTSFVQDIEPLQKEYDTALENVKVDHFSKRFLKNIGYIDEENKKKKTSDKFVRGLSLLQDSDKAVLEKNLKPPEGDYSKAFRNIKLEYFSRDFLKDMKCYSDEMCVNKEKEKGSESVLTGGLSIEKLLKKETPQTNKIKLFSEDFMKSLQCYSYEINEDEVERKSEFCEAQQNIKTELFSEDFMKNMQCFPNKKNEKKIERKSDKLVAASPLEESSSALFKKKLRPYEDKYSNALKNIKIEYFSKDFMKTFNLMDTGKQSENESGKCKEASDVSVLSEQTLNFKNGNKN